ncbi:MAG: acyclic terpene utilization AtuA family protein [Pseudomonadota bacterium]
MKDTHRTSILVPIGALGLGIQEADVERGLAIGAHAIACDAGSTDSGPAYLATGKAKYSRAAVKADLAILMRAQHRAGIPLLVGSCGTSGCDQALDWTRDIALEIAAEEGLKPRIALLYSEQDPQLMARLCAEGRISPLAPMKGADPQAFLTCDHIVALMGPEPYIAALKSGADIVLGGRTTDTAVLAAVALMRGAGEGPAWHASKIAECGALCTIRSRDGGVMIHIGDSDFEVEPLRTGNRCTPETVSAHMLYENSDPFLLHEPGGTLDVTNAHYEAIDERKVRVTGSTFSRSPYTMKLEGAGRGGWQTLMLVGIQDRKVLQNIDAFLVRMHGVLTERVRAAMGDAAGSYHISLRPYGWNAVSGLPVPQDAPLPREIGLLFIATARTQELATQIAKTCNPWFFHLPVEEAQEMPSYGFPFSPAELERGQVFEFKLNHIVSVDNASALVRTAFVEVEEPVHV